MSDEENPFKWAKGVGAPCLDPVERKSALSDDERDEAFMVEVESEGGSVGEVSFESRPSGVARWFDGVAGWIPGGRSGKQRSDLSQVTVKRNDLWEADWEVHVADSGEVDLEPKPGRQPGRKSFWERLFCDWF